MVSAVSAKAEKRHFSNGTPPFQLTRDFRPLHREEVLALLILCPWGSWGNRQAVPGFSRAEDPYPGTWASPVLMAFSMEMTSQAPCSLAYTLGVSEL